MTDIVMRDLWKDYGGEPVLAGFSAVLPAGGVVALLGPSGAGKTTLARLLLGLEAPDGGDILGAGVRFGCVFQEDRLCPGLSAVQNVQLVLPRAEWHRAEEALLALGLTPEDVEKPAKNLSGGQRRRVALARAVEAEGEALVLDEAFKGLDEENRRRAYAYILARRRGRTLLLITHDESEAESLGAGCIWLPSHEKHTPAGEETGGGAEYYSEGTSS